MADDPLNPEYYKDGGIETIDFIQAKLTPEEFEGFLKGTIFKYTSRMGKKGSKTKDAGKLKWYCDRLNQFMKGDSK